MRVDCHVAKNASQNVDGWTFTNFESCITSLIGVYISRCQKYETITKIYEKFGQGLKNGNMALFKYSM